MVQEKDQTIEELRKRVYQLENELRGSGDLRE